MIAILWAKFWKYIVALGALLATIAAIFLKGRASGVKTQEVKTENAVVETKVAQANNEQMESRHDTDEAVNSLPEAQSQPIATADPKTAAGELHSDWSRDG